MSMDQPMELNPMSMFYKMLSNNALLSIHFNEFMKVTKLVVVQIIWDPWKTRIIFSTLTFMKTRF
jgi:hypothetical protein